MLSHDSLLEHGRERGMPAGKLRGLVREYIHILTLKALYGLKESQGLIFLGGTALRLGFEMPRFSQDLDFDARDVSLRQWRGLVEQAAHALSRWGLSPEARVQEKALLLTGDLRFPGVLSAYRLETAPGEKLRIKVEANRPEYPLATQPKVVAGFGEMFPVLFAASELLFAEKIIALMNREMARDVYDTYFMAVKRWKPDARVLKARNILMNPGQAILYRMATWGPRVLTRMARQLEPFLFDPGQSQLVAKALELLPSVLGYLRDEPP